MRHKHADLIHQIAEGGELQAMDPYGNFYDCFLSNILKKEYSSHIFRIKPGTENSGLPPGALVGEDRTKAIEPALEKSNFEQPKISFYSQGKRCGSFQFSTISERTQLTVREQFAMAAMQSYIGAYTNTEKQEPDDDCIVAWSFEMADAMLKASGVSDKTEQTQT